MKPDFLDGVMFDARRNYRDCPRSWHIPAENEFRRPSFAVVIAAVLVVAVALVGAWV